MANRLFTVLLTLILGMQGWILYRQYRPPRPQLSSARSPVQDISAEMDLRALPALGSTSARVALVEFSDFECPFCEQHAGNVAPALKQKYVSTGRLLYAFANNPLPSHGKAKLLATAGICAGPKDFWKIHGKLRTANPVTSKLSALHPKDTGAASQFFTRLAPRVERTATVER
jgi:hypothetical protein